ncbi:MAG: CDP-diacylglycerol--glycerol-3-phosphate 3-phosphatidyltransferase [Bacteroidota bacterium]
MTQHLPNLITFSRILVTPFILVLLLMSKTWVGFTLAAALFIYAAISDYWDGKLARERGTSSRLGRFLDPLADKVLVLGTFIVLAIQYPQVVPWWAVALVAIRDVAVTAFRSYVEAKGQSLRTTSAAKWKTTFQLTFVIAFLVFLAASYAPEPVGSVVDAYLMSPFTFWLMIVTTAVTLWTGALYFTKREMVES